MPSPKPFLRTRGAPVLALLGTLALPGIARADFKITYLFTDENGQPLPQRRLTTNDMAGYSNLASCQCGHVWGARVFLDQSTGTTYAGNTQIDTYVGYNCADGQEAFGSQNDPCVKVFNGTANDYDDNGIFISFEQVWLSSRSQVRDQLVGDATPISPCDPTQTGAGGIWICVESNNESNCQKEEFVVSADISENSSGATTPSPTGMGESMAPTTNIQFDYLEPQDTVTGFRAASGDGAVEILWDRAEVADINGFRVLCVDADGNVPVSIIDGPPTGISRTNGKLYYTAENLCPGEVKYESEPYTPPDPGSTTGGSDTGRDTDVGTGGTTVGIDAAWLGDGWSMATTGTTGHATGSGSSGSSGSSSGGSGTGGSESDGGSGAGGDASVLTSLDWRYVCSEHLSDTSTKARVEGLENGKEYSFLVVAYDKFGNPKVVSDILKATPAETSDFWEQCEQQGDLCGSGGFCACTSDPQPANAAWLGAGLLLLGAARRRRGQAR